MKNTQKEFRISEKDGVELVEKSHKLFANLMEKNFITENKNNYFRFEFKKTTTQKMDKGLWQVPGWKVVWLWKSYGKTY